MFDPKGHISETSGQISIEWLLEKSVYLPSPINSPKFIFLGSKWHIHLETYTMNDDSATKWLSVYLLMKKYGSEQHFVKYTLGIKNLSGKIYHAYSSERSERLFENKTEKWGEKTFIEFSTLCDGHISFKETVIIYFNAYCPKLINKEEAASRTLPSDDIDILLMSQDFANLFLKEQNSDANILVGEREFRVHKSIIAARSPVFAAMFERDMLEKQTGIVTISDCDPDAFHNFLYYLYSGKVDKLADENVVALYAIAHKYDVKSLIRRCLQFMVDSFSEEWFCDFLSLAVNYSEPDLLQVSVEFFTENAEKIVVTKEWQTFMKENNTVANELLYKAFTQRRYKKS